jgi:hypothetical protein
MTGVLFLIHRRTVPIGLQFSRLYLWPARRLNRQAIEKELAVVSWIPLVSDSQWAYNVGMKDEGKKSGVVTGRLRVADRHEGVCATRFTCSFEGVEFVGASPQDQRSSSVSTGGEAPPRQRAKGLPGEPG